MNILTKIRLINELNDKELRLGVVGTSSSWHNQYKDSAWVYTGGFPYELSEGDLICVFSQYGEIVHINLIRDKKTGKSKGFAFICYEDQRSTVLAVDNLNGAKIKGRQMRVDHVLSYKVPKDDEDLDELTLKVREKGVAPGVMKEYETPVKEEVEVVEEIEEHSDESDKPKRVKKKRKKEKKKKKGLSFLKETPKEKEKKSLKKSLGRDDENLSKSQQSNKESKQRKHTPEREETNSSSVSKSRDGDRIKSSRYREIQDSPKRGDDSKQRKETSHNSERFTDRKRHRGGYDDYSKERNHRRRHHSP